MKVFTDKTEIQKQIIELKNNGFTFGFVPTMGALHEGHLSLVKASLAHNDYTVLSVFVNPTQFDNPEDLEKYPRTLDRDISLLETVSKDIWVYAPTVADIYDGQAATERFKFDGLEFEMEGRFREGHFDGVGTIVKRLFEVITPHNAYFGEKDFQQLAIIKKLVQNYAIPVNIVGCKIHREANGLAMSSRNARLKPEYKTVAPFIYATLKKAKTMFTTKSAKTVSEWVEGQFKSHQLLELEYFIIADETGLKPILRKSKSKQYRGFIAVYADEIRLIDNIALN